MLNVLSFHLPFFFAEFFLLSLSSFSLTLFYAASFPIFVFLFFLINNLKFHWIFHSLIGIGMVFLCLEAGDKDWSSKGEMRSPALSFRERTEQRKHFSSHREGKTSSSETQGGCTFFNVSFMNVCSSPATFCHICLTLLQILDFIEPCSWTLDYLPILAYLEWDENYHFCSCFLLCSPKSSNWWHVHLS